MKTWIALSFRSFKPRALMLASLILLLSACRPATKGGLPTCSPDFLQRPTLIFPMWSPSAPVVDTLTPTFTWSYPDLTCNPEHFRVMANKSITGLYHSRADTISKEVSGSELGLTLDRTLEPGTVYYWRVLALSGGGDETSLGNFFRTGPQCPSSDPGLLSPPILTDPEDGEWENSLVIGLEWDDPTECIPLGTYLVDLDTNPTFPRPYQYLTFSGMTEVGVGRDMNFDVPLRDCTRYYWRVRADLTDRPDAEDGPWSPTWSFFTNVTGGYCPAFPPGGITPIPGYGLHVMPEPSSYIEGHVWHDVCALPYESTDIAPPGCVWVDSIHGYEANGVYDTGEPGIASVQVDLGAGACPSTGLTSTTTASDGRYAFGPLAAGTYCISISATADPNIPILLPGGWTFPVRDAPIAQYQITLLDADIRRGNDFGWDYQFLPAPVSAAPTATLKQNAYCLRGPGEEYDSLTILTQGSQVPIEGRNQDGTWWWVRVPNSQIHCWVGSTMVQTAGNVNGLPLVEAPPLACWVYQKDQSKKCVSPCPEGAQPGGECKP